MTRSRSLLVFVLLSCLLLSQAQGIRFDKLFKSIIHHDLEEKESTQIIKIDTEKVSLAKEEHSSSLSPSSGNNRKLITDPKSTSQSSSTSTSSTTSKNDHKNENFKAKTPSSTTSNGGEQEEKFKNVKSESYTEIAEMDYSPARRKPPIHN